MQHFCHVIDSEKIIANPPCMDFGLKWTETHAEGKSQVNIQTMVLANVEYINKTREKVFPQGIGYIFIGHVYGSLAGSFSAHALNAWWPCLLESRDIIEWKIYFVSNENIFTEWKYSIEWKIFYRMKT